MKIEDYIPTFQDKSFDTIDGKESHSFDLESPSLNNFNGWADFWHYRIGINVIPADTRNKVTYQSWSEWHNKSITDKLYNEWKHTRAFSKSIAVILGRKWHDKEKFGFQIQCLCKCRYKESAII